MKKKKFMVALAVIGVVGLAGVTYAESEPTEAFVKADIAIPIFDKDQQDQLDSVLKQGADVAAKDVAVKESNDNNKDEGSVDDSSVTNVRTGQKSKWDSVNVCYTDTYDDDGDGRLHLSLYSINRPDSVFYGINNIRIEFFDAAGNKALEKNAINKHPVQGAETHWNGVDVIDKFELKFGQTYKLKFYDASQPSTDENLLATYDLEVYEPKKSDKPEEYRFEVSSALPACNVRKKDSNEKISDRLKYRLEKLSKGDQFNEDMLKVDLSCLSSDNNEDSVFKEVDSLIVDFVDKDGVVIFSKKTDPTKVDERLKVVKSKDLKIGPESFNSWLKVNSIKFYEGSDDSRREILANFNFDLNKTPHLFDVLAVYETD